MSDCDVRVPPVFVSEMTVASFRVGWIRRSPFRKSATAVEESLSVIIPPRLPKYERKLRTTGVGEGVAVRCGVGEIEAMGGSSEPLKIETIE
jgi:hypothetical protein